MRIDAHQHFWNYDPAAHDWIDDTMQPLRRDFGPADLAPELARAGFGGCVAVQVRQTLEETRWLLELAERYAFIAGVVGWVELRSPELRAQLEAFDRHPKLVGVRHIVQAEPDEDFLLGAEFGRGIALLEEFDLAYDILIYPRQLAVAAEFVRRFPRQRFVLDHLAKPPVRSGALRDWERGLRELARSPNVFAKLSGLVTEADWERWSEAQLRPYLDVALDCFGAGRLMAGSDWPVCTLAAGYGRVMRLVIDYVGKLPPLEQAAILGGNAQRFWKLGERGRNP